MKRSAFVLLLFVAGCSGNGAPGSPAPSHGTITGTVTATNGGQPLAGASIDVAGNHAVTDAAGAFVVDVPGGQQSLMISGAGILPRVQFVQPGAAALDAITQSNGFDLAFYREFVRNGFEAPSQLEPLRRWTAAPMFDIQTTNDNGAAVNPDFLAVVRTAIAEAVPLWSGGQFQATFGPGGVSVRFVVKLKAGACGQAIIGPVGAFMELQPSCATAGTIRHETGHVMGFWHTSGNGDLMRGNLNNSWPSERERYHAAIAYRRPVGNVDPDTN